ncbi:hypothetical protein V5N11_016672 [Cardamine amara subsp. amara]|uniref:Uncharacterized protein n=1 Tax=Cardamine amara subsp. amara TaxID=228776 RepID=A0ABD0Z6G6_CARAN
MGNCALKPKVLSERGAPAPEELKDSLLVDQKIDAAKSLSNLFLQDKAEKKTKEDEKITPDKMLITEEDLKTSLADEKSPVAETKYTVIETKAPADEKITPETENLETVLATERKYQKVKNEEEAVREEKVVDDVAVKETETEAKAEEVGTGKRSSTMQEA